MNPGDSLPALREELAIYPGPVQRDGPPTWTLHDPTRNAFFRIDWQTFEILKHWSLGEPAAIAAAVQAISPLNPTVDDVADVGNFLAENQLFERKNGQSAEMARRLVTLRGSWLHRLLHNYLFFRIPLVRPDAWLGRHQAKVDFFWSQGFLRLTLLALVIGLFHVSREWERFTATLVDTLSWSGLAAYAVALAAIKVAHELGHGFAAKRHGCRVPTMGLAFLVLWPMAYTDTNETWKLADRRQRFAVAAAGLRVELTVAAWALLAWAFLPEGIPKSIAFVLTTTALIATLAINASPFMRFDGYFLLSDGLDMPNLHARAFATARWDLRERLFAFNEPVPELFSPQKTRWLIMFAWATWLYRLVLFLGIAVLVYHFFIKAVGILLFVVEIGWFIALPVWREWKEWQLRWPVIRHSARARRSALLAGAIMLFFVLPWPSRIGASGLIRPANTFPIHAPAHAQVKALPFAEGASVKVGTPLIELVSPELVLGQRLTMARIERLRWQASMAGFDPEQRARQPLLIQELRAAEAQWAQVTEESARYRPLAPFNGQLRDLDPDLRPGDWVGERERLAVLVAEEGWLVESYLDESEVHRVSVGDSARFYADGLAGAFPALIVMSIDRDTTRQLPDDRLATHQGGSVLARPSHSAWVPERSVYRVTLSVQDTIPSLAAQQWRGKVVIAGSWEAPGWLFLKSAVATVWREMGF